MKTYKDIDSYIASYPEEVQVILRKMRATIRAAAPKAEEAIRYGLPTFRLNGKNLVHFGGFKKHIGFYPTPSGTSTFQKELSKYKAGKGSIQFPLDQPMPWPLITKIVKFRVKEK
jgi:uncharacterized protein YdhG (YjbR/CyaY superfamily)